MNRDQAWEIVCEFVRSDNLRKHTVRIDPKTGYVWSTGAMVRFDPKTEKYDHIPEVPNCYGIALDKEITIILSQNDDARPLCGIYFNLHTPYKKDSLPKTVKAIVEKSPSGE